MRPQPTWCRYRWYYRCHPPQQQQSSSVISLITWRLSSSSFRAACVFCNSYWPLQLPAADQTKDDNESPSGVALQQQQQPASVNQCVKPEVSAAAAHQLPPLRKVPTRRTQQLCQRGQYSQNDAAEFHLQLVEELQEQQLQLLHLLEEQEALLEYPSSPLVEELAHQPAAAVSSGGSAAGAGWIRHQSTHQRSNRLNTLNLLWVRAVGASAATASSAKRSSTVAIAASFHGCICWRIFCLSSSSSICRCILCWRCNICSSSAAGSAGSGELVVARELRR